MWFRGDFGRFYEESLFSGNRRTQVKQHLSAEEGFWQLGVEITYTDHQNFRGSIKSAIWNYGTKQAVCVSEQGVWQSQKTDIPIQFLNTLILV